MALVVHAFVNASVIEKIPKIREPCQKESHPWIALFNWITGQFNANLNIQSSRTRSTDWAAKSRLADMDQTEG